MSPTPSPTQAWSAGCQIVADACYCYDRPGPHGRPRNAEDLHRVALANLQGEYAQVCLSSVPL